MTGITVIIPTLNEDAYIVDLLNSLENQSVSPKQILVVDGNSTDKTKQLVKKFKTVTFLSASPPVANQRNLGATNATGDLLIFLDADTIVPFNFIQNTQQIFRNQHLSLACPWYTPSSKNPLLWIIYLFFDLNFWLFQKILPSGAGTCLIIRKSIFLQSQGFNPLYKFEDIEFIRRISRQHSFSIIYLTIKVSPRRFYKQGIIFTFLQYLLLSVFFCTNQFKIANKIPYIFGNYKK